MSMQSKKRRDQKKKAFKKKAAHIANKAKDPRKMMKQISENHLDLLQNIEFALISCYRRDDTVDDCILRDVLKAILFKKTYDDIRIQELAAQLQAIREMREDISADIWNDALRVVLDSINTHSSLAPEARGYIDYISPFVK